ncbi:unnamed protein product [Ixodes persulcatus]
MLNPLGNSPIGAILYYFTGKILPTSRRQNKLAPCPSKLASKAEWSPSGPHCSTLPTGQAVTRNAP